MTSTPVVRPEVSSDHDAVRRLNEAAFKQPDEAKLVDALRENVTPLISLVAELDDCLTGHILFSPVTVESDDTSWMALGLAPMAVAPDQQKQGIGSALIRAGLDACRALHEHVIFVLGYPEYYPRFGFVSASPLGLRCEYDVPDEVFMVIELEPGALAARTGLVKYAPAFGDLG